MAENTEKNYIRVRVNDADTLAMVLELAQTPLFRSKSEVASAAIAEGLPHLYKKHFGRKMLQEDYSSGALSYDATKQLKEINFGFQEVAVIVNILEHLCATLVNLEIAKAEGAIISADEILSGAFSDLPESLELVKSEMFKRHLKSLKKEKGNG